MPIYVRPYEVGAGLLITATGFIIVIIRFIKLQNNKTFQRYRNSCLFHWHLLAKQTQLVEIFVQYEALIKYYFVIAFVLINV